MTRRHHSAKQRAQFRRRRLGVLGALVILIGVTTTLVQRLVGDSDPPAAAARQHPSPAAKSAGSTAPSKPTTLTPPTTTIPLADAPPAIAASAQPGPWAPVDSWAGGAASVLTTTFHPDPSRANVVAYAAWIRTATTQLALYPGYKGPGPTKLDRGPQMVPRSARSGLLASFNSGFYEADAAGGFYAHGTLYFPMINGLATVVAYANGSVDVVNWQQGPNPPPGVIMARQNLTLLVDHAGASPDVNTPSHWGVTLHGAPAVWRTALGIDTHGNLLYVAAAQQTAASLAQILVSAGAARGMELDINPEWPIFITYGGAGAAGPALFVPNPNQIPSRFLYSSTKDFFAVFARVPGQSEQPW